MTLTKFEPQSQSAYIVKSNRIVGHLMLAGPILKIQCTKRIVSFEMHRYFGPIPIRADGEPAERLPAGFWDAIKKWEDGGLIVDGDICFLGG